MAEEMKMPRVASLLKRVIKSAWLKETLLAVPRIALLVPKLLSDERLPRSAKMAIAGGGPRLTLNTVNGSIRLHSVQ